MSTKNKIRESFIKRSWFAWGVLMLLGVTIVAKIILTQSRKEEILKDSNVAWQMVEREIQAKRGNIYATDGISILATSIPQYKMVIDPTVANKDIFDKNINALSQHLAQFFKEKSAAEYKRMIVDARNHKKAYIPISNRWLTYDEKEKAEQFPIFNLNRNKGGGYFEEREIRFHPFNTLAERTIGNIVQDKERRGSTGIEAQFDEYLKGKNGRGFYERLPGNYKKPVTLDSDVSAEQGLDIVTTLDVNFQDIAESALRNQLQKVQGKYGSVVIMEIETGEVKAIANLTRKLSSEGQIYFADDRNYAVAQGTDPGSTFKLVSMLAVLEKTKLKPDDFAVDCKGQIRHGNRLFTCSGAHGNLTVKQVFEQSCNVGIYTLIKKGFGFSKSNDYYKYLENFRLLKPTGFQLTGEPSPYINTPDSKYFTAYTIPWLSIGYESRFTPLQVLSFYNAVANEGYWVQPLLVKEIRSGNKIIKTFDSNKATAAFASQKSIDKVKSMMEGVITEGTARKINYGECKVAGKTGTAQKWDQDFKKGVYYTSFAGYFPADNPKYSCIVVIDEPSGNQIYAADVSAPVFKTIAEKVYAFDIAMHKVQQVSNSPERAARYIALAKTEDQSIVTKKLKMKESLPKEGWAQVRELKPDSVIWQSVDVKSGLNNLVGMTLKDALPLLEEKGYSVRYQGLGKVAQVILHDSKSVEILLK